MNVMSFKKHLISQLNNLKNIVLSNVCHRYELNYQLRSEHCSTELRTPQHLLRTPLNCTQNTTTSAQNTAQLRSGNR